MAKTEQRSLPVYQQVANILRARIVSSNGELPVALAGECELAKEHRVARGTIRQALGVLAAEGLIQQTRGRSTVTIPAGIAAWRQLHKSRVIQVITSDWGLPQSPSSYYGQIYQGILVRSEECGYQVSIRTTQGSYPRRDEDFRPEDPNRVAGVVTTALFDEHLIAAHAAAGYPVVCTDYWPIHSMADGVVVDCYGEGQMAAEFLVGLGHRVCFYLGNNHIDGHSQLHHESDADLVEAGFRRGLRAAGLALPANRVRYAWWEQTDKAISWFLSLRPRPTAGVVFNMGIAQRFVEGLRAQGVRCPQDVSIVARGTANPIKAACLQNDPHQLGRKAVDLLLERLGGVRKQGVRVALASTLQHGLTVRSL